MRRRRFHAYAHITPRVYYAKGPRWGISGPGCFSVLVVVVALAAGLLRLLA